MRSNGTLRPDDYDAWIRVRVVGEAKFRRFLAQASGSENIQRAFSRQYLPDCHSLLSLLVFEPGATATSSLRACFCTMRAFFAGFANT